LHINTSAAQEGLPFAGLTGAASTMVVHRRVLLQFMAHAGLAVLQEELHEDSENRIKQCSIILILLV